jgi:hypothetical protein
MNSVNEQEVSPKMKMQIDSILKEYGLDFTIVKSALTGIVNGKPAITPYYGLYNSKTLECINTVKAGYGVSQNASLVEMILRGTEKYTSDLQVTKAGPLHGGRQVYMQMQINGHGHVGKDIVKRYVTIIDSNDGSTSLSVGIGDLTMSCKNQFYYFYSKGQAKFRHTATIEEKIKKIPQLIEIALEESLRQIKRYNVFLETPIDSQVQHKLVNQILGYDRVFTPKDVREGLSTKSQNRMKSLYDHIEHETNDKGLNLWGLHSGVTRWTTHEKKGPKRVEDNGKEESMLIGSSYKDNINSFQFVKAMANLEMELA